MAPGLGLTFSCVRLVNPHSINDDVFDLVEWSRRVGPSVPERGGVLYLRDVIGPRQAWRVHWAQRMLSNVIALGRPKQVDFFILSVGEAPERGRTKIGGLPWWPRKRPWPLSDQQKPLPFIAQFNFGKSLDIGGELPGDVLLLFGDPFQPSTLAVRWQSLDCEFPLVDAEDIPDNSAIPRLFGSRWRTEIFPDARCPLEPVALPDGTIVKEPWFACRPLGMQIGIGPFSHGCLGGDPRRHRTIASLSSVFPILGSRRSFLNHSQPLQESEVDTLTLRLTDIWDADGFGVACILLDETHRETLVRHINL